MLDIALNVIAGMKARRIMLCVLLRVDEYIRQKGES